MDRRISNRAAARLIGAIWAAAGFTAIVNAALPSARGTSRGLAFAMGIGVVVAAAVVVSLPWDRWSGRLLLVLVPVSFGVIATGPLMGTESSQRYVAYNHAPYFVVVLVWIGLTQARWTSALLSPVAAVGYALPLALSASHGAEGVKSVTVAVPICVLVGETIARVVDRLGKVTAELEATAVRLAGSEARFRAIVDRGSDALLVVALDGTVSFVSESGRRVLGDAPERFEGRSLLSLVHPEDVPAVRRMLAEPDAALVKATSVIRFAGPGGAWLHLDEAVSPMHEDPKIAGTVLSLRDGTVRKDAEAELQRRATRDALTGLANRDACSEHLERALAGARRDESRIAVLFVDLDGFKRVNDEYGHEAGDMLLVAVAARMGDALRSGELLARVGGDEFVAVIEGVETVEDAERVAERLVAAVSSAAASGPHSYEVTASIGVAVVRGDSSAAEAVRRADAAMYRAKGAGRNRFELVA